MNWPVAVPVRRALFGKFPKEAVIEAGRELLALGWYDELNALCWEAFHYRPDWFPELVPIIEGAMSQPGLGEDALPQAVHCLELWRNRPEPDAP